MTRHPNDPPKDPKSQQTPDADAQRRGTLTVLIRQLDLRIQELTPQKTTGLLLDIRALHPGLTVQQAQRESWTLLRAGVAHLCDGGPGKQPGMLTTAVSKASLRSAALSASIGVAAPVFELAYDMTPKEDGHAEAVFHLKRMTEAVENDIERSVSLIRQILVSPDKRPYITMTKDVLRQNIIFFENLHKAHASSCGSLMEMIKNLKPPRPPEPQNVSPGR